MVPPIKTLLSVYVVSSVVVCCDALVNPIQDLISRIQGPGSGNRPPPPLQPDGAKLLQELNLSRSTEPVLAGARAQQIPNLFTASIPAVLRIGSGAFADGYQISLIDRDDTKYTYAASENWQIQETGIYKAPDEPLILYEFESCPFCRKVREACSMLSLPVTFRPTPQNGRKFRPAIKTQFGEKVTFPYLIDPNTGVSMFESNEIITYLFKVYGSGNVPWTLSDSPWVPITAGLGVGLARMGAGGSYQTSNAPEEPLVLWAYEGSPFCKIVREALCAMEIPHTVLFTPRGSPNRQKLWEQTRRFQVPYLEDPNTGVSIFESEAMTEYIQKQYSVADSPVEYM